MVQIFKTGSFVPEKILTNHDLEMMVETSDEWITTRTGIKERILEILDQRLWNEEFNLERPI